jgi:hypothetical protein
MATSSTAVAGIPYWSDVPLTVSLALHKMAPNSYTGDDQESKLSGRPREGPAGARTSGRQPKFTWELRRSKGMARVGGAGRPR